MTNDRNRRQLAARPAPYDPATGDTRVSVRLAANRITRTRLARWGAPTDYWTTHADAERALERIRP